MYTDAFVAYGVAIDYKTDIPVLQKLFDAIDEDEKEWREDEYGAISSTMSEGAFFGLIEELFEERLKKEKLHFEPNHPNDSDDSTSLVYTIGTEANAYASVTAYVREAKVTNLAQKKKFDDFFGQFFPPERIDLILYTTTG